MYQKLLSIYRMPSAEVLAQRELEECKRDLLQAERMRDYYAKIAEFNKVRITQLNKTLREPEVAA